MLVSAYAVPPRIPKVFYFLLHPGDDDERIFNKIGDEFKGSIESKEIKFKKHGDNTYWNGTAQIYRDSQRRPYFCTLKLRNPGQAVIKNRNGQVIMTIPKHQLLYDANHRAEDNKKYGCRATIDPSFGIEGGALVYQILLNQGEIDAR